MLNRLIINTKKFLTGGSHRTSLAKINILVMFLLKGLGIFMSLLIVPLTIDYVNPFQYGVWITISSVIGWLSFFDIGFGNGLRHKLIEALVRKDYNLAKTYVSTTYAILLIIVTILGLIVGLLALTINWSSFLNAPEAMRTELTHVVLIVLVTFAGQFVLGLITTIFNALQRPFLGSLYSTMSQFIILIGIVILKRATNGNLINLSLLLGGANIAVLIAFTSWFFLGPLRQYRPSLKCIKFKYAKDLISVGVKYFFLQIIAVVYYETNNIIIAKVLNPTFVTTYNIGFKYMSVLGMFFSIILSPFWSAFIEAKEVDDYAWMRSMTSKLRKLFFCTVGVSVIMVLLSPFIYNIWIGSSIQVPWSLTLLLGAWQIFNIWNSFHSTLIYGFGKVRLQLLTSSFIGILNIPVTLMLCRVWNLNGIVFGQIILLALISWIGYVQLNKLLNKNASGVWNE